MNYILGSSQVLAGIGSLVLMWFALFFVGRRNVGKPMTNAGFAVVPAFFLLWFVGSCVLILSGLGAV
jgi:Mn2+/Fe2+ NRAMP family transporter